MKKIELNPENYFNFNANYGSIQKVEGLFNKAIGQISALKTNYAQKKLLIPLSIYIAVLIICSMVLNSFVSLYALATALTGVIFFYFYMFKGIIQKKGKMYYILCIVPGAHILIGAGILYAATSEEVLSVSLLELIIPFVLSAGFIYFVETIRILFKFKKIVPQKLELDYTMKIFKAILQEFPKDVKAQVTFNPYLNMWSEQEISCPINRPGYNYKAFLDLIGLLKIDLPDKSKFSLRIISHRTFKQKIRKSKFKGNKYRMVYDLDYKIGGDTLDIASDKAVNLSDHLRMEIEKVYNIQTKQKQEKLIEGTIFPSPFKDPEALKIKAILKGNKLSATVTLKSMSWEQSELTPANFLPPILILSLINMSTDAILKLKE